MSKYIPHNASVRKNLSEQWEKHKDHLCAKEVADKMGVDPAEFSRIIHQKSAIRTDFILRFCAVTGIQLNTISWELYALCHQIISKEVSHSMR